MDRPLPLFAVALLVLLLAGLVAVGSGHTPIWALFRSDAIDRLDILASVIVLFGVGGIVMLTVTFVAHRVLIVRRRGPVPLRATWLRALPIATVVLAAASLLMIASADGGGAGTAERGDSGHVESSGRRGFPLTVLSWWSTDVRANEGADARGSSEGGRAPDDGAALLLMMIAAGVTALAGAGVWRWQAKRQQQAGLADADAPADAGRRALQGAIADTIDAMLADPDPNTAIRGAYARLLEGLAASGTGRRDHEAPVEHLRRVLTMLDVRPGPLRRLIGLFEVARFSTHPLTASHRDEALRALRDVATDLALVGPGSPAAAGSRPVGAPG